MLGEIWYLDTARHLFVCFLAGCREPYIPPWDFDDPDPQAPVDTSATAIVAAQLSRIAVRDDRPEAGQMVKHLDGMLDVLCGRYLTDGSDGRPPGMLLGGCFNYPKRVGWRHELLWGDYYLLEALYCLEKGGLPC